MSELRKAAEQALDVLAAESVGELVNASEVNDLISRLEAALAPPDESFCDTHCTWLQHHPDCFMARTEKGPEPEPVAWRYDEATYRPDDLRGRQWHFTLFSTRKPYADEMVQNVTPLYTAPPQRKPLTDEEIQDLAKSMDESVKWPLCRAIEKAHGIVAPQEWWPVFQPAELPDSEGGEV